ncbi:MAG: phosphate ABC transporter substrate-binding protein [Aestuariibacter sp.]|jgi:phosphate transport system substrate-binding protein|nr:phosphate ABC transporter [Alteromonadaceae bacterium]MCP3864180.1 phosphate ABC transporter substrate-binding protein [Aestuariibacter sp.]MCP4525943.1 phosphate ABC transporter substrate-binding protein [Aestuariibacter sp.]MCP4947580.1 phosphate ABC transporter substrate-binding protein [Aestuariibacter sp.]MCP5013637.1 phosphate ABC transporter substrate-binding protein [Aestuariibacter sp.]|tara:strand:+ start:183 stop:1133 length:951 start_codon:yes stop_codon:yes gene_type:complete
MMRIVVLTLLCCWSALVAADAPEYERKPGVAGKITSVGSDTLANLMTLWSQEFKHLYPDVKFQIQASGSSTAPPALTEGTATIGPMSRELKPSEIQAFIRAHGYPPTVIQVALDAIAIFVERRNPLPGLTLSEVDAIFSATRFCGGEESISHWSQLGVDNYGQGAPIRLFSRNSVSGTYGLFKIMALCDGDFTKTVNEQPGSASVVLSVASSKGGMGYAAYGYKTAGVRALPLGENAAEFIPLNVETVREQQYPFTRFLYLVINKSPDEPLPTLVREFLTFVLSDTGQKLVARDGYFPIKETLLLRQRRQLLGASR